MIRAGGVEVRRFDVGEHADVVSAALHLGSTSASKIAEHLGWSRQRAWKAVQRAQKDGAFIGDSAVVDWHALGWKMYHLTAPLKRIHESAAQTLIDHALGFQPRGRLFVQEAGICEGERGGMYAIIACRDALEARELRATIEDWLKDVLSSPPMLCEVVLPTIRGGRRLHSESIFGIDRIRQIAVPDLHG